MSSNKLPQLKVNPVLSLFSSGQFVDTLDAIDLLKKEYKSNFITLKEYGDKFNNDKS